jgi:acyl-CoA synthetase (AMP-forming)/AMP-acid ligase II
VLAKHPAVHEACVIGAPSAEWGETPVAVVALEPGAIDTPESIREWANARLGKSQRISRIEIATELPKNAIGKVLKRELKARFAAPS